VAATRARSVRARRPRPHSLSERGGAEVLHRLRLIAGQVQGVQAMIEDGRDYREVLMQVNACRNALTSVRRLVFRDGVDNQLRSATSNDDVRGVIDELISLVNEGFRLTEKHGG
jgi:DNA-binding FrmR family transcriptional regulator